MLRLCKVPERSDKERYSGTRLQSAIVRPTASSVNKVPRQWENVAKAVSPDNDKRYTHNVTLTRLPNYELNKDDTNGRAGETYELNGCKQHL